MAAGTANVCGRVGHRHFFRERVSSNWDSLFFVVGALEKSGFNDNLVTRYAELCDSMLFTNLENVGVYHHSYDEEVLPLIDNVQCNIASGENNFYFIHLMGSHYSFERRYRAEYNRFSSADYCNFPEWQRETRSHYDNSVLYNDYVVSEIYPALLQKRHFFSISPTTL